MLMEATRRLVLALPVRTENRLMNVARLPIAGLIAFAWGLPMVVAQDRRPIVDSEPVHPIRVSVEGEHALAVGANSTESTELPPIVPASGLRSESPAVDPVPGAAAPPRPLRTTDSKIFAQSTVNDDELMLSGPTDRPQNVGSGARMPKMTKMFSFDTTDKFGQSHIAPALGQFVAELSVELTGPEAVAVDQVFQQFIHVRNSGRSVLQDVRVTQVCDLDLLGVGQYQVLTIDRLDPGEAKVVRFSARACKPGTFAVRYIAQNALALAEVDNRVRVAGTVTGQSTNDTVMRSR
jgi:hypothetical protein